MSNDTEQTEHPADIRQTSYDSRYAGVVFGGVDTIEEAIAQARAAPEFALDDPPDGYTRSRAELLKFLGLL